VTVTNPYYEVDPLFVPGTTARSDDVNTQYQALQNAFDLLPGDADALTTGTATFAPESGSGNAFVVTMPDTRLSNQDGDEVIFFASHSNTGAATLNVDSIGAIPMVDHTGAALSSGQVVSGRLYTFTYDATNVRFIANLVFNTTTNILDVVQGTGVDDPTSPGTFDALLEYENSLGNLLGDIGYNADTDLSITNKVHGGNVVLAAENAAGALQTLVTVDPDTEQIILPLSNDPATPTLTFGDGDTGFYESVDDTLDIAIGGNARWFINSSLLSGSGAVTGALKRELATATNPSLLPNRDDQDTGIGRSNADQLALIAGGQTAVLLTEALTSVQVLNQANTGLTADVGSSQGDGVIESSYNVYASVGTAGDAATLPSEFGIGSIVYIKNDDSTNSMDVFPASGDDAGAGTDTAVAIAAGDFAVFMGTALNTTWTKLMGGTA
jgi:hypothetical protein